MSDICGGWRGGTTKACFSLQSEIEWEGNRKPDMEEAQDKRLIQINLLIQMQIRIQIHKQEIECEENLKASWGWGPNFFCMNDSPLKTTFACVCQHPWGENQQHNTGSVLVFFHNSAQTIKFVQVDGEGEISCVIINKSQFQNDRCLMWLLSSSPYFHYGICTGRL